MAGLALMAGGAGRDANALARQVVDDVLAGPAHQRDRQNKGGSAVGDQLQVGDSGQLLHRVSFQLRHMSQLFRKPVYPQLHRFCKACDLGGRFRSGADAALLTAACQQGLGMKKNK